MAHIIIVTVSVGAFLVCEATINVWIGDFLVVKQIPYYAYGEFTQGPDIPKDIGLSWNDVPRTFLMLDRTAFVILHLRVR